MQLDVGDAHGGHPERAAWHRSRNRSSPPRRCSTPARSSSSIPATRPSSGWKSRACSARSCGSRRWRDTPTSGSWKNGVQLRRSRSRPGRSRAHAARADVARSRQRRAAGPRAQRPRAARAGCARSGPSRRRPRRAAASHSRLKQTRASAAGRRRHHLELKGVVEPRVHELEREPERRVARGAPDLTRAPRAASAGSGRARRPARHRRAWARSPSRAAAGPHPRPRPAARVVWRYSASRNGSSSRGRWYLTDGTASISPRRVRSPAGRTSAR